ncbi:MAG: hypothetical protein IJ797_09975 [Selenomonadaceae bacterium]|nr:hypothetical protein [Selenomonadaceae bacterium]
MHLFSDVFDKTSKEILLTFDSFSDFADISTDKLEKSLITSFLIFTWKFLRYIFFFPIRTRIGI